MKQHPLYTHLLISEDGQVFSTKTNRYLKTFLHKNGYFVFCTRLNGAAGKSKSLKVHRLVAETYHPNLDSLPQVNHIDGNKLNNSVINLEWVTNQQNMAHAKNLGLLRTQPRDLRIQSKITTLQLSEIKAMYQPHHREFGLRALGRKYGISHPVLSRLVRRGEVESPSSESGSV